MFRIACVDLTFQSGRGPAPNMLTWHNFFSACKITGNTKIGEIITTCFEVISKATPLSRRCVLITIVF